MTVGVYSVLRTCLTFIAGVTLSAAFVFSAEACTRAVYVGDDGLVVTGRSLDWPETMNSELWVFPRGMERDGAAGPKSVTWTSEYGSLIVSTYDSGSIDGMNEKGLVMNGLYLVESDYGPPDSRPTLTIMALGQYLLDNFGSVAEAVEEMQGDSIRVIAPILPNGMGAQAHASLSDPTGDSAIFEYIDGGLGIHHSKEYKVMTNSPSYDQQLAIKKYWEGVDPLTFLPGSVRAADRFVRVSYLIDNISKKPDETTMKAVPDNTFENQAVASVLSVMRALGKPLSMTHPSKPNLSSSLWRTVWNQEDMILFFDSATRPNTFWVPLSELDFSYGAEVKKLPMTGGEIYAGNAADKFEPAKPFEFMSAEAR
jgi:choloylglycine hydrolase